MLQSYSVINGRIAKGAEGFPQIEVYILPDETERNHLINDYGVDEHTLLSSTDPDETPRIEFEDNHTAVILKYPKNYSAEDNFLFKVKSMGIFIFPPERIVIVLDDSVPLFTGRLASNVKAAQDVLLKTLLQTIRHFETHLRVINMCSDEIEHEINKSCGNKNLLNMFTLEKGLVYYVNALNGNRRVIERMKVNAQKFGFTEENIELLDDLAIENRQFLDQAEVYSQVLSGLMDARASIINNNLNVMMKNMNAIVIAISVPTFFTGVFGMSEFTAFLTGSKWFVGYPLFVFAMLLLALFIYWLITRSDRNG
ncbi:MAG: magnesium transporter CorA family protein [Victivallales bacterium]|nr:divalent metal ion transporter [Lentisphaeria bacterium]HCG48310.1 divalent metal ion transporter [Lentisphaeria bacterium]